MLMLEVEDQLNAIPASCKGVTRRKDAATRADGPIQSTRARLFGKNA